MKKFFGTDGIRGIANHDLTPELALRIGRAGASVLSKKSKAKILLGKDPRVSSDMLEGGIIAGILSTGADAVRCGVIPTPAISFLTRDLKMTAGIMISASHNPIEHNGIKIFAQSGFKLSDLEEKEIESILKSKEDRLPRPTGTGIGKMEEYEHAVERYIFFLKENFSHSLAGMRIVLDCAYGATSATAPAIFEHLGAKVISICAIPDGSRINVKCGATDLELLQKEVTRQKADMGIAFDGDGDRAMLVTHKGETFNGDHMLAALAIHWKKKGRLRGPVITTVMANLGLEHELTGKRIPLMRTSVGDRYVLEEMLRQNSNIGGEQSGHLILLDHSVSGDGCLTALQVLRVVLESGKSLHELRKLVQEFPQMLVNVSVQRKTELHQDEEIQKAIHAEEIKLKGRGRILVRPSGTEPLVRVMAEGPDKKELEQVVSRVARAIERRLK